MAAALAMFAAACAEDAAPPPPRGDELVLELGGSAPSLRAALQRKAPKAPAAGSPGNHTPTPPPGAGATPAEQGSEQRDPPPAAQPAAAAKPDAQAKPDAPAQLPPSAPPKVEREPDAPEETIKQADPSRSPPPRRRDPGQPVPASADREGAKPAKDKPAESGGKTVRLRRGQNLYRVALEQLGDGQRWREIAALNGWSEREIANLAPDTPIRLPAR